MSKIWAITRKELYTTFTDASLLLLMLAAPLAIATIIGVTFGSVGGGSAAPVTDIPVALINLDTGTAQSNDTGVPSSGQIIVDLLTPPDDIRAAAADVATERTAAQTACNFTPRRADAAFDNTLWKLIHVVEVDDAETARACVDNGVLAAVVTIPADFSVNLTYAQDNLNLRPVTFDLYTAPDRPISASIVRSVVENIANQIAAGNIAIAAVLDRFIADSIFNLARIEALASSAAFNDAAAAAFSGQANLIRIEQQTATGQQATFNPLVFIGASQAIFFALFTANGGATSIIEERRNWTLQRLFMTPTPQFTILVGKMSGIYAMVVVQLVLLFGAFAVVGSLIAGEATFIWGSNVLGLLLVLLTGALAVTGLGAITAAVARTPEQASTIGTILSLFSALLGGSFGFSLGEPLSYLSVVYWGSDAFSDLAAGRNDILLNVIVLTVIGVLTFTAALWIFNRRMGEN